MRVFALVGAAALCALSSLPSWAAGDAAKGATVFQQCQTCHTTKKGEGNGIGPNLFRIVGRKAASVQGFYYSSALKSSGIVWTQANLERWVMDPAKTVPGNRMTFPGVHDPAKADDLVAFLASLK